MQKKSTTDSMQQQAGRYLGVGMAWALSTALFLYLGTLVDAWLGSRPWFTLIGAFIGAAAGFYNLFHTLSADAGTSRTQADDEEEPE